MFFSDSHSRYEDLVRDDEAGDLHAVAERAFGHQGLGIVVVTGVPDVAGARRELFALGHKFAALPEETKARYEHPQSCFSFGWSHGKESLETGGPDLAKGSFYANPCFDAPFGGDGGGSGSGAAAIAAGSGEDGGVEGRGPDRLLHRPEKGDHCGGNNAGEEGGGGGGGGVGVGGDSGPAAAEAAAAALVEKYPSFAHPNVWPDADVPGFSAAFKALGRAVVRVGGLVARQCDR
ncbi:unnamed protein product [Ectocarpus sp. CCAP 1310/34]|nr:unnamed protein product [Ectocarpus sp. CCAP 1310/34]